MMGTATAKKAALVTTHGVAPGGRAPLEIYRHLPPAITSQANTTNSQLPEMELNVLHFNGRSHLPVVQLRKAA